MELHIAANGKLFARYKSGIEIPCGQIVLPSENWDGCLCVTARDDEIHLDTIELDREVTARYKGFQNQDEWNIWIMLRESESNGVQHLFNNPAGPEQSRDRLLFVLKGMTNTNHANFRRKVQAIHCVGLKERIRAAFNKLAAECGCPAMP